MAVAFVVGLANTRPDAAHQFIVMGLTVVETPVGLSERVGFLPRGDQVTFGRKSGDDRSFITASGEVADRGSAHALSKRPTLH
jgi:hypothetical protein